MAAALACAGAGPAHAEQWFRLEGPELEAANVATVEIDLDALHPRNPGADAVIRVSLQEPKLHPGGFNYRSFIATALFDCQRRAVSLTSAAYFSETAAAGVRLGSDSVARHGGMPDGLLDSIPASARRALLRASCAAIPAS
ncbi:MAG: hypothetical protein JWQ13_4044 [Ramlibacter sp.]|nr:hypothetical protein [Ramlibacter sp.]